MMLNQMMHQLGPGAEISYLGHERGAWHCDIKLPRLHYTVSLVTASGEDADAALRNTVERAVTKKLNKNNTSGVRGVRFEKRYPLKPWLAQIHVNGKGIGLGLFATKEEAIDARKRAELLYFGEECP